jgi:Holliday junction resolvasome RuvABC endonuclease subunit
MNKIEELILALDIATKTGWAHGCGISGVQDFKLRRGDSPGMRLIYLRSWLNKFLDSTPTKLIIYEQAHHRGGAPTHVLHSMIGVVEVIAAEREIEITNRMSGEIKKHATGGGKATKAEMIEDAVVRWRKQFPDPSNPDDNQADALWLLDLAKKDYKHG